MARDLRQFGVLKFLGKDLIMKEEDRNDPLLLMLIAQVELMELKFKEGLFWLDRLSDNYGLRFDISLENNIRKILIER